MEKRIKYILLAVLLLAISSVMLAYFWQKSKSNKIPTSNRGLTKNIISLTPATLESMNNEDNTVNKESAKLLDAENTDSDDVIIINKENQNNYTKKSTIKSINDKWNKYTNYNLGFTLNIPKKNAIYNRGGNIVHNVKIMESGNVVYLIDGSEYQMKRINEIKNKTSDLEKISGEPFAFLIKKLDNHYDLNSFVRDLYLKSCSVKRLEKTEQENVFQVRINLGKNSQDDCFMTFYPMVLYYKTKNLVAAFSGGQDYVFVDSDAVKWNEETSNDDEILSSFRFIE